MDVSALLETCTAHDIRLTVAEGTLHCDAPTGALTEEVRAAIAQHKPQLLALLAPPTGETAAAPVELADQRICPHDGPLYTHRDLRRTCLTCGAMLLPVLADGTEAPAMEPLAAVTRRVLDRLSTCGMGEHVACQPSPGAGGLRQCQHCPHVWEVPTPAGVLHLWSDLLHDEVYGTDSLTHARALWAASQIAVYTPGELRRLRQLQRTDPDTFPEKLTIIHELKKSCGCTVDEVIIPPPQEKES